MIVLSLNTSTAAKSCMLCGLLHPRRLRLGLLRLPRQKETRDQKYPEIVDIIPGLKMFVCLQPPYPEI